MVGGGGGDDWMVMNGMVMNLTTVDDNKDC